MARVATTKKTKSGKRVGPLGVNLRRIRDRRGLTQEQLAERAGVVRLTVQRIESGTISNVQTKTLDALAEALAVKVTDLTEPTVATTPVEPLLQEFLASPHAKVLDPPLSAQEIEWLRSLPGVMWIGLEPTPLSLRYLVEAYRSRKKGEG